MNCFTNSNIDIVYFSTVLQLHYVLLNILDKNSILLLFWLITSPKYLSEAYMCNVKLNYPICIIQYSPYRDHFIHIFKGLFYLIAPDYYSILGWSIHFFYRKQYMQYCQPHLPMLLRHAYERLRFSCCCRYPYIHGPFYFLRIRFNTIPSQYKF